MNDTPEQARIGVGIGSTGASHDPFAAAVRITRVPMIGTDPHQHDNPIVFANDAFLRLTGYAREEVLGRNCRFLQGPATGMGEVARVREAIATRTPIGVDLQNHRKDGSAFRNRLAVFPVFDRDGALVYFFASLSDVTDERRRLRNVSDTAEQRELMLDAMIRCSSEVRYRINADWSSLAQLAGGDFIPDTAADNPNWLEDYIPPEDRDAVRAEIARAVATRSTYLFEHRVNRIDGTVGWANSRAVPLFDAAGEVTGWFGTASDITARKRAEAALAESEAYWRGLFERLNEGFMVVEVVRDAEGVARTWRFAEINAAWERISGLSRVAAAGRAVDEVIPGVEQEWIDRYIQIAETGEPQTFRIPLRVLNQVYEVRASRVAPDRVGVLFQEVSAQQRDERHRLALLELMDRLRDLDDPAELSFAAAEIMGRALGVDRVGYGTFHADGETLVVERNWTAPGFPSAAGRHRLDSYGDAILGLRRGETIAIEDIARDPRTRADAASFLAVSTRALVNLPLIEGGRLVAFFFVNAQSPRVWAPEDIAFIRHVAEHTRATIERRRAERGLRQLAATLEQQVEQRTAERDRAWRLSQHLLVTATAEGVIESVNPMWTRLLGWEAREIAGTSFDDYTHPDDLQATRAAFASILEKPLDTPHEYRFRHKDSSYRWFGWTGAFEDGRVYATGRDLTVEREQAEALRQSQKMEAVGQLTGGVAHDFNNLLTVIRSSVDLLKRPNLAEERRARYMGAISDTVQRAAKLTGQLLAFARRQALKPEVFAACDSVRTLGDMLGTITGPRIEIVTDLPEVPCFVNADSSQFDTGMVNMAVNARDAMGGEGRLTIRVRAVEELPAMRLRSAVPGAFVAVSLTDTGSGIPPNHLERIFEPFFTTKEQGKGTGLGLSQVFGFAKQSGGEITVESRIGEGSTFTLFLPRVAAADARPAEVSEPAPLVDGHGTCVLVVEDNTDVGTFATQALAELGYHTVLAASAEEALAELARDADRFDVVFSDVVMPGMSGIELGQRIRQDHPDLPVVLTSGYSHVLAQNGTYGFELLHKPYSIEQLSCVLRSAATWQRRRRIMGK